MALKERSINFVANFLLGVAWVFVVIGAISSFVANISSGLLLALVFTVIGMLPGLAALLFIEHFFTAKAAYYEQQKQTQLLQRLIEQKEQGE